MAAHIVMIAGNIRLRLSDLKVHILKGEPGKIIKTQKMEKTLEGEKDMRIKILIIGVALFFMGVLFAPVENTQAATKKNAILTSWDQTSCKIDLDGDGKKETLKLKTTMFENDYNIKNIGLYVNGKKVLAFRDLDDVISVKADYCKITNSKIFIRFVLSGDSDVKHLDNFYKYDSHEKKMLKVGELLDVEGWCANATIKSVSNTHITVSYQRQFSEIGSVLWTSSYIVKNGKLKLKSNMSKVKSAYTEDDGHPQDEYGKRFEKNQFKALKKFQLYKNTSLKKVSFLAKKNNLLVLKKIKFVNDQIYVQFKKGTRTGWIKLEQFYGDTLFYGVSNRLAG